MMQPNYGYMCISEILDGINTRYFLPDIQREFVWLDNRKDKQIEQFFDSLLKGFPLGYIMVWQINRNVIEDCELYKFLERYDIKNYHNEIYANRDNRTDLNLVIDGQQRLTTLYLVLKGQFFFKDRQPSDLYINLNNTPKTNDKFENYEISFLTEKQFKESNNNTEKKWWAIKNFLDTAKFPKEEEYNDISLFIANAIRTASIGVCRFSTDKIDETLEIFIRANSKGVKLTKADLLMSVMVAKFSENVRQNLNDYIDDWQDKGFKNFDKDILLKTMIFLITGNAKLNREIFDKENVKKIEDNWVKITDSIDKTMKLLEEFGCKGQKFSINLIPSIALYCYNHKVTEDDKIYISNFIKQIEINGFFDSSTDTQLTTIKTAMIGKDSFKAVLQDSVLQKDLEITKEFIEKDILDIKYGTSEALPILQYLFPNYSGQKYEIDHIYPKKPFKRKLQDIKKKYLSDDKDKKDRLFNLQFLTKDLNTAKSDTDPQQWIGDTFTTEEARQKYRKEHLIPDMELTWENIEKFEEKRKQMLVERLKEIFNIK